MYLKYYNLLGRRPISDQASAIDADLIPREWRDTVLEEMPALDIVVSDKLTHNNALHALGYTLSLYQRGPAHATPARVYLPADLAIRTVADVKVIVAHELFHAFQFAFLGSSGNNEDLWLIESSATWAKHFIYPEVLQDDVREFTKIFIGSLDVPLTFPRSPRVSSDIDNPRHYGSWPIWQHWYDQFGSDIFRRVFMNASPGGKQVLRALENEKLIGEGEANRENWRKALIYLSNDPDLSTLERDTRIATRAAPDTPQRITLAGQTRNFTLPLLTDGVAPLSVRTFWLSLSDEVRTVTFYNGIHHKLSKVPHPRLPNTIMYGSKDHDPLEYMQIQFIIRRDGEHFQLQAMSTPSANEPLVRSYCRDARKQNYSDVMVMIINSSSEKEFRVKGLSPLFRFTNIGCFGWEGHAKAECPELEGTLKTEVTGSSLRFQRDYLDDFNVNIGDGQDMGNFALLSGEVEAIASGEFVDEEVIVKYEGQQTRTIDRILGGLFLSINEAGGTWAQRVYHAQGGFPVKPQ